MDTDLRLMDGAGDTDGEEFVFGDVDEVADDRDSEEIAVIGEEGHFESFGGEVEDSVALHGDG